MRFQVPQFIEIEDKIFGPLTLKQFIYLVAGGALSFILYRFLPFFIAVIFIIPVVIFFLALAFYKVNNKPFIHTVEAAFKYSAAHKLYLWKKKPNAPSEKSAQKEAPAALYVPRLSDSRLKDLSWSLDVSSQGKV